MAWGKMKETYKWFLLLRVETGSKGLITRYAGCPEKPRFSEDLKKGTFNPEQTQNCSTDV